MPTEAPKQNPEPRSLEATVGALVRVLTLPHTTGWAAELRRMRPESVDSPAFWKLAVQHLEHELTGSEERVAEQERRWSTILAALATLAPRHRPRFRLGRALAEAGVSEARLLKLLRARGGALPDALRAVCHQLNAAGQPVDGVEIARLVLSEGRADEETVRRQIARTFYRTTGTNS